MTGGRSWCQYLQMLPSDEMVQKEERFVLAVLSCDWAGVGPEAGAATLVFLWWIEEVKIRCAPSIHPSIFYCSIPLEVAGGLEPVPQLTQAGSA